MEYVPPVVGDDVAAEADEKVERARRDRTKEAIVKG
jgi:hypothetical protein